jgi:hypothetical protein
MPTVETTTIRVRRSTQRRLAEEAKLAGTSVIEMLDAAADLLAEQRLLASMDRSYRQSGSEIRREVGVWDATLGDGLPDQG